MAESTPGQLRGSASSAAQWGRGGARGQADWRPSCTGPEKGRLSRPQPEQGTQTQPGAPHRTPTPPWGTSGHTEVKGGMCLSMSQADTQVVR